MLETKDLVAVKKIIEEALNKHIFTCPLTDGFTREELKDHGTSHRDIKEYMKMTGKSRRIWYYFLGLLVTIYVPLLIKLLWP
jgi:hypothetical protein